MLIIPKLNLISLKNKFDSVKEIVKGNVYILLISETKINFSFPTAKFYMDGFTANRYDRNLNGGGIILHIRDDIPSTLLNTETSIEGLYGEVNERKKKRLI